MTGGFSYDPAAAAVVCNALAACQGRPAADDPDREPQIPTPQQRWAARSLVRICEQWLAGTPGDDDHDGEGGGRRARPAYVVTVDGDRLDASQPGLLRLRLPGPSPRVSGRRMATDAAAGADVRVVVTAGGAPQAVSEVVRTDAANLPLDEGWRHARALGIPRAQQAGFAALLAAVTAAVNRDGQVARVLAGHRPLCDPDQLDATAIPTPTRVAVAARDRGCRFAGCRAPVDWCDVHHLVARDDGGDHHPDRLALFCRPDHRRVHAHGWQLALDPATGVITGRRGDRVWRSEPRGTPLAPAPADHPRTRPRARPRAGPLADHLRPRLRTHRGPDEPRAGPPPDLPF